MATRLLSEKHLAETKKALETLIDVYANTSNRTGKPLPAKD